MTLPTTITLNGGGGGGGGCDDDSDMFGPPRTSPPIRKRVPMISPKLRQREERKRILQLCAHKLERIKDSETNLRRSVCINNTYCRLTDELRREKQSRYLANLPKSDTEPESARESIFNPYNSCGIDSSSHQPSNKISSNNDSISNNSNSRSLCSMENQPLNGDNLNHNNNNHHLHAHNNNNTSTSSNCNVTTYTSHSSSSAHMRKRHMSSSNLDNDLEILDRELNAINAPMPLIDPEITQGAAHLEKAVSSRKRLRSEDESDRLVREALSQFYIPPQRLISAIEDCPLDVVSMGGSGMGSCMGMGSMSMGMGMVGMGVGMGVGMNMSTKRPKLNNNCSMGGGTGEIELDFDMNQNQKEFEVIMDALRLGTPSPTGSMGSDSCGQAAMMSESASVFHNLVVTSLET